jgi:hypothetical protein
MSELIEYGWNDYAPRPKWSIPIAIPRQKIFLAVIKADGAEDFEIPVSTITIRLRDVLGSYISVTVPNPELYTADIIARIPGRVHILAGELVNGIDQTEELIYGNVQNIYFNQGQSNTLTVAATRFITHRNPAAQTLIGVSNIRRDENGRFRVRCATDFFVKPTDTITYGDISFTADLISHTITAQNAYMEVEGV